jgi:hypothetical protein
LRE